MAVYFEAILSGRLEAGAGSLGVLSVAWRLSTYTLNCASQVFMGATMVLAALGSAITLGGNPVVDPALFGLSAVLVVVAVVGVGGAYLAGVRLRSTKTRQGAWLASLVVGLVVFASSYVLLDPYADANPSFHMLEHLAMGAGGFLTGVGLKRVLKRYALSLQFARVDKWWCLVLAGGSLALMLTFSTWVVAATYTDETIHLLVHATYFLVGAAAALFFGSVPFGLRVSLTAVFAWMGAMNLPFALMLGPYSYSYTYFDLAMSLNMLVWPLANVVLLLLYTSTVRWMPPKTLGRA
jgi:hypothetical protein